MKEIKYKSDVLKNFVGVLLDAGLRVYRYNDKFNLPVSWLIFGDNENVGYVQVGSFGGLEFSTKHKACLECGTGFRLSEEANHKPTIEDAKETFILYPSWATTRKQREAVQKYKGLKEYFEKEPVLSFVEVKK